MEVKIDADELCELRQKAKGISGFVEIKPPEILTLTPADCADKIKKLEEERDWWRTHAIEAVRVHDRQDSKIADFVTTGTLENEKFYFKGLVERAATKNYRVE